MEVIYEKDVYGDTFQLLECHTCYKVLQNNKMVAQSSEYHRAYDWFLELVEEAESNLRTCPGCNKEYPKRLMNWTKDNYGNPFRLVCDECYDREQEQASQWVFDPDYAGERMEEDY